MRERGGFRAWAAGGAGGKLAHLWCLWRWPGRRAKALLSKGAPNDRIAIVRRTNAQGGVDWRVELGPVTVDQAAQLQSLLQTQGLEFDLE